MTKRDVLSVALAVAMWPAGCGGYSDRKPETEGSNLPDAGDSGVEQEPSGGLSCDLAATPCGGDVVGSWAVMDCPLELAHAVDVRGLGLGCAFGETISGSLEVSGTLTLDEMGLFWDETTTNGTHEFFLPAACMGVAVVGGCESIGRPLANTVYETAECVDDLETGGCICSGTFAQQGGLGSISISAGEMARYSSAGTRLTLGDEEFGTSYDYCVMDDAMVLTLPDWSMAGQVVGSIVLQKQ